MGLAPVEPAVLRLAPVQVATVPSIPIAPRPEVATLALVAWPLVILERLAVVVFARDLVPLVIDDLVAHVRHVLVVDNVLRVVRLIEMDLVVIHLSRIAMG